MAIRKKNPEPIKNKLDQYKKLKNTTQKCFGI